MAEPILELVVKGTDQVGAVACGKCKIIAPHRDLAALCCMPRMCECGAECEKHYVVCKACRLEHERRREAERFAKARKVPEAEWADPVCDDGLGGGTCGDGYFHDVGDLREHCESEGIDLPEYVWGTKPMALHFDADDIISNALEEWYEDAGMDIPHTERKRLQKLLDEWCAAQGLRGFEQDSSVAVLLDQPKGEEADDAA